MKRALFVSKNLLGDGLYTAEAIKAWQVSNSDYEIDLLTTDNYVTPIYSHFGVPLRVVTDESRNFNYDFEHTFDVSAAAKVVDQEKIHIAEAYAKLLGVNISSPVEESKNIGRICKVIPTFLATEPDAWYEGNRHRIPGEIILLSMFSMSCSSRQGNPPNKMLPWWKWEPIVRHLRGLNIPLRMLGAPEDRAWLLDFSEEEYLTGVPLNALALIMKYHSKVLITVDNGMGHMAASQRLPTFLMYPACLGLHMIVPWGHPYLSIAHMDPVTMHDDVLTKAIIAALPILMKKKDSGEKV